MSDYICSVCGRMKFRDHVCPPVFDCRFADVKNYGDHWGRVRDTDPEAAAERFAEEYDCNNEHHILQQGDRCEEIIEVRNREGTITRWRIHAESVPHYYAEEAEEEDEPDTANIGERT